MPAGHINNKKDACPGGVTMRDNWDWEEIKGKPLGWSGQERHLPSFRIPGNLLRQSIYTILLWLVITIIFWVDFPGTRPLQTGLRHYLTSPAADYTEAVADMARSGLWLDSYDRWVFHFFSNQGPGVPVVSGQEQPAISLPLSGSISRPYGLVLSEEGQEYYHNGIDILAPGGTEVRAALTGRVIRNGIDPVIGRVVEIDHGQGLVTVYGTLGEVIVESGQLVEKGAVIAYLAEAKTAQLHFEVRRNGQPVDPTQFLALPANI